MWFAILFFSTPCFSQPLSDDEALKLLGKCGKDAKEQLIEQKKLTSKFDRFVWGDLFHAEVHGKQGELESFVVDYDDACFLAQHKNEWLKIEYQLICQSLPDHGGYVPMNVITRITTKHANFKHGLKSSASNHDECEKLINKHTVQP